MFIYGRKMHSSARETSVIVRSPPRADAILDQCKTAFARKGFDGASMQDLARAAGMSAGNFYRYFPSKDAIIVALVERELRDIEGQFAAITSAESPRAAFLDTLVGHMRRHVCDADQVLWAEIQAAAARRPAVSEAVARMEETVVGYMIRIFALIAGIDDAESTRRFRPHAAMMFLLVRGAAMTGCSATPSDPAEARALNSLLMRTANALLDDLAKSG